MAVHEHWQPPRLYTDVKYGEHGHGERKVRWLELFYDLVYVTTLTELGDVLSDDVSFMGFVRYFLLFIPIWWSWTGVTLYTNRFVADDVWHRVLIFVQIFAIAALGISVSEAWGALGVQFTLAYVGIRLVLVALYVRAARQVPQAHQLASRYATGFLIAALIWLAAVFVPPAYRPYVWLIGMIVDFLVPLSPRSRALNRHLPIDVPHLVERYGLFTIIVLGESFVKVLTNASGTVLTWPVGIFSVFALTITCLLWWLYFDDIPEARIQPTSRAAYIWIYSHLPIAVSLIAFGVGVKKLMTEVSESQFHDEYRWLISVAMIMYFVFVGLIDAVTVREDEALPNRTRSGIRFGAGVLILLLAIFGAGLTSIAFIGLSALIFIAEVAIGLVATKRKSHSYPSQAVHSG
jgi:low temperature requirement protein LtrA